VTRSVVAETQVILVAGIEPNITFEFRPNLTPWIVITVPPAVDPFIAEMLVMVGRAFLKCELTLILLASTSDEFPVGVVSTASEPRIV